MLWSYGSYVGNRLITLIAIALLARLLTPREFGLVAIAVVIISLLEMLRFGLTQALVISSDDEIERHADSAFVFGMGLAFVLFLLGAAMGPVVAEFYGEEAALWLVVALAANFVVRGLGMTHYALAQRALDFRERTMAEIANATARGVVSIALALAGFGAWSLVIGYLAGSAAFSLVLWITVPFRPRLSASWRDARHLFGFGGALTGVDVLWGISAAAPELIVGRVLGVTALGLYTLALRLPELIVLNLSIVAAQVFYPAFAALRGREVVEGLKIAYRYTMLISLPLTVFLVMMAEPLVLVVFGDQWGDSVAPMQALAIFAFGIAIAIPAGSVLKALGRVGLLLIFDGTRAALTIVAVLLVANEGILAVSLVVAGVTVLLAAAELALPARLLGFSALSLVAEAIPAIRSTAPLAVVLIALTVLDLADPLALVLGALGGAAAYLGSLWLFDRETLNYLVRKIRPSVA